MRIKSFGISLAVIAVISLGFAGCGESGSNDSTPSSDLGSGTVVESTASNDIYTKAQNVKFNNEVFSITGTGNSSSDVEDWYTFTAPESGIYICGIKYPNGTDFVLNAYHSGTSEVSGSDGSIYTYSDEIKDAGYSEITWIDMPDGNYTITTGSKIYLQMKANSTGGNNADYTIDCFTPTKYADTNQTGIVTEDNKLINSYQISAHQITLDSSNNVIIHGTGNSTEDKLDYYKFTTPLGGDYNITLTHNSSADFDVTLLNPDGSDKGGWSNGATSPEHWTFTALSNAEYFLKVDAYSTGGNDANYTIEITKQ